MAAGGATGAAAAAASLVLLLRPLCDLWKVTWVTEFAGLAGGGSASLAGFLAAFDSLRALAGREATAALAAAAGKAALAAAGETEGS